MRWQFWQIPLFADNYRMGDGTAYALHAQAYTLWMSVMLDDAVYGKEGGWINAALSLVILKSTLNSTTPLFYL